MLVGDPDADVKI